SEEQFRRITLSFYRYAILENIDTFRNELYSRFNELNVLGRIFIATEGINAQLSVPDFNFKKFRTLVDSYSQFKDVAFKIAVEDVTRDEGRETSEERSNHPSPETVHPSLSFYKLIVRIRNKIVA